MLRSAFIAAVFYVYGHPHFDGYRPEIFDRPLQSFYTEVSAAAREGQRVLDGTFSMRALKGYIDQVEARLKSD
jgi:hypothetical protein